MTDKKHDYDPDLPYVVERDGVMVARTHMPQHAKWLASGYTKPPRIIDTTPAPRVPEDARFITWRDQGNDRWYAEREGDTWCTDDGGLFGDLADLPDVTPDTVITVLDAREERKTND